MRNLVIHLATLTIVATVGCKSNAKPSSAPGVDAQPASESATQNAKLAKETSEPADAAGESNTQCRDDRDCDNYLRCEDGECVVPPAVDGRQVEGMPVATFTDPSGAELAKFSLEIADDPWERTRGLMFRRKMDPDFGMLFIFPAESVRSFWMKNTYIPLDMVHLDASGTVVGVVESAEPLTLSPRRTGEPARYVLELTAGRAAEVGLSKGAKMTVTNLPERLAPQ